MPVISFSPSAQPISIFNLARNKKKERENDGRENRDNRHSQKQPCFVALSASTSFIAHLFFLLSSCLYADNLVLYTK